MMRMIIELSENDYKALKDEGAQNHIALVDTIIANSVPYEERPEGEWKFSQGVTTQGSLKCPFCDYRDYHNTNSNFCPNCGAKMKGGAK